MSHRAGPPHKTPRGRLTSWVVRGPAVRSRTIEDLRTGVVDLRTLSTAATLKRRLESHHAPGSPSCWQGQALQSADYRVVGVVNGVAFLHSVMDRLGECGQNDRSRGRSPSEACRLVPGGEEGLRMQDQDQTSKLETRADDRAAKNVRQALNGGHILGKKEM